MFTLWKDTPYHTTLIDTNEDGTFLIESAQKCQDAIDHNPERCNMHDYTRFIVKDDEGNEIHRTMSPSDLYLMQQKIKRAREIETFNFWRNWEKLND